MPYATGRSDCDADGLRMELSDWLARDPDPGAERSGALDLLGFERPLVFSASAATRFAGDDLEPAGGDFGLLCARERSDSRNVAEMTSTGS